MLASRQPLATLFASSSCLRAVDTAFLFLELGVGTAVGSLALVADSFHMYVLTVFPSLAPGPVLLTAGVLSFPASQGAVFCVFVA